ncbi:MAG: extracellular solute-binding protein [Hyphomicrobium sp.]|nr:extracellular solute-binding protein [Hyphomicrobium sp.]
MQQARRVIMATSGRAGAATKAAVGNWIETRSVARLAVLATLMVVGSPAFAEGDSTPASAQKRHHALSLMGAPALSSDFAHFPFANPNAPKGGTLRMPAIGTFDSLNAYPIKGVPATGLGLVESSLMFSSPDEPSTEYGLLAEWVSHPDDYSSVTFGLRPEAKFHDGQPVTPEDVIFSLEELKKVNPQIAFYYKNVVKAEKTGDREVTFTFDKAGNRELPLIVGQLSIIPKHYWTGKDAKGEPRDLAKSTLDAPLGSGPYKVKLVEAGRRVVYERVKDWWGTNLPVSRGLYNFDEISYVYFKDRLPAFEAFKSGVFDFWPESVASAWATQYDFDAVKKGLVAKEALPHARVASMQGFTLNSRRKAFEDIRVRRAFVLAFNFEALNKSIFYGQYVRSQSFFGNSELEAKGLPEGRELEILTSVKDQLPPEVFTTPWKSPVSGTDEEFRNNMRQASKLLEEAGWKVASGKRQNAAGEPLKIEILLVQPDFERIALPYIENLKRLGIEATARVVDSAQYTRREDTRDFDIIVDSFGQSHSPGNEQRDYWGSDSAKMDGSRNTIGIKNPAIDKIVDAIVFAKDRAELVAATRALDRALLWNFYVVPQWYYPFDRVAYWNVFGRAEKIPSQSPAYFSAWWIDPAKQSALAAARGM